MNATTKPHHPRMHRHGAKPPAVTPRSVASRQQPRPDPPTERNRRSCSACSGPHQPGIGHDLFLSTDTVKTHASRLFRRLGAHDRGHAVALAMRTGLVT